MARIEPVLSSADVEALLEATDHGRRRGVQIRPEAVDLLASDRFLQQLVPTLSVGYARVAEHLRKVLASVLRQKVEIHDEAPEILTGRGLLNLATRAGCVLALDVKHAGQRCGYAALILDPILTFSIIERLFGGSSGPPETPTGRAPTALERRMLLRALQPVIKELNANLEPQGFFDVDIHRAEGRLDLIPGFSPDVAALHVPFTMLIGDLFASLALAIPAPVLEPLREAEIRNERARRSNNDLTVVVLDAPVVVTVELGAAQISLNELLTLQVGQILKLDRHRAGELTVAVEGTDKFLGNPVHDAGIIGIEITRRIHGS